MAANPALPCAASARLPDTIVRSHAECTSWMRLVRVVSYLQNSLHVMTNLPAEQIDTLAAFDFTPLPVISLQAGGVGRRCAS